MAFSLSVFDKETQANNGAWLHLINPETGKPAYLDEEEKQPVRIKLRGMKSSVFEQKQVDLMREMRQKQKDNKEEEQEITLEDLQKSKEKAAELYASLTIELENIPSFDGNGLLKCSFDNLKKLYLNYLDIRVQVGEFIAKDSNFIKG